VTGATASRAATISSALALQPSSRGSGEPLIPVTGLQLADFEGIGEATTRIPEKVVTFRTFSGMLVIGTGLGEVPEEVSEMGDGQHHRDGKVMAQRRLSTGRGGERGGEAVSLFSAGPEGCRDARDALKAGDLDPRLAYVG
jgi:hypothetical protein